MMEKHFLDTSVLRPILTSPQKVKEYYKTALPGEKYVCDYVKMEFLRGYICSCISFYFLLAMPQYANFGEALHVWSNRFQIRDHKNIENMIVNLLTVKNCLDDKRRSLRALADYIRRLIGKLNNQFRKIGNDSTYCSKSKFKLTFEPESMNDHFKEFQDQLKDNEQYKQCKINHFIKTVHKSDIEIIIKKAEKASGTAKKKGFDKIVQNLKDLSEKDITCAYCSKLGDAVIALLADEKMRLEHTDNSFEYLCPILKKKHQRHPIDTKIMGAAPPVTPAP